MRELRILSILWLFANFEEACSIGEVLEVGFLDLLLRTDLVLIVDLKAFHWSEDDGGGQSGNRGAHTAVLLCLLLLGVHYNKRKE